MGMCEDAPCCGHEMGCCPDYDERGRQMNVVCVCGAKLPRHTRYSICESCMNADEVGPGEYAPRMRDPEGDDSWIGNYGANGDWEAEYWKERAREAEAELEALKEAE